MILNDGVTVKRIIAMFNLRKLFSQQHERFELLTGKCSKY
jgi:hypothetical protein